MIENIFVILVLGTGLGLLTKLSDLLQVCGFQIWATEKSKCVGVLDLLLMKSPNLMLSSKYQGVKKTISGLLIAKLDALCPYKAS